MLFILTSADMKTNKCRKTIFPTISLIISTLAEHIGSQLILGLSLLTGLPAFIFGCSGHIEDTYTDRSTVIRIMESEAKGLSEPNIIDILVFNDDKLKRLDSYQRFPTTTCSTVEAASTAGNKIFTAIVNSRNDRYDLSLLNSREAVENIHADLESETRDRPLMSGECRTTAGMPANIMLKRLRSEIILNSISCDFTGRSYPESEIKDPKIYLTNVNAEAPVIGDAPVLPHRIINAGGLNADDIMGFKEPDMVVYESEHAIGPVRAYPEICFLCYPNEAGDETPGTPFTRLVIEGTVGGHRYYWPIDINRENDGTGISRNCRYIYDITITRLGTSDPDTPVRTEDAEIKLEVKEWREGEEYGVRF